MADSSEWLLDDGEAQIALTPSHVTHARSRTWSGWFDRTTLGPGLYVHVAGLTITARTELAVEPAPDGLEPWISASGFIAGSGRMHLPSSAPARLSATSGALFLPIERRSVFELPANQDVRYFSVGISREALLARLEGQVPAALKPLIEGRGGRSHVLALPGSPAVQGLLSTLYDPPYRGPLLRLHREGVALLYLAEALARAGGELRRSGRLIGAREEAKLHEARERLLADMRDPPTVSALAAAAGLSPRRLVHGFRDLFDATPAQLLRRHRLEHAHEILAQGALPLKQVAWRVGYGHASNFIAAFTAQFGIAPGRLRRSGRR